SWGTSPPLDPSDGGGRFPPEGNRRERALGPLPGRSRRRGRLMPATPSISWTRACQRSGSAFGERDRDKARLAAGLHAHQHDILVVVLGGGDRVTHVVGVGHRLAGNFEDDI